jgi:hypothetical protein
MGLVALHKFGQRASYSVARRPLVRLSSPPTPDKGRGQGYFWWSQLSFWHASAWACRLGNRSGLEWILDQYKEKKPKDPTILEKFNTYRFADYKEKVIDLLARVTRVSVETMEVVEAMKKAKR